MIRDTDRDSYSNKRVDLPGSLLYELHRELWGSFQKNVSFFLNTYSLDILASTLWKPRHEFCLIYNIINLDDLIISTTKLLVFMFKLKMTIVTPEIDYKT